jgi:hypothetical protein
MGSAEPERGLSLLWWPFSSARKAPGTGRQAITFGTGRLKGDRLTFHISEGGHRDEVYFTVPAGFHAHNDSIAACLGTLAGKAYESIHFRFPVSDRCRAEIARRNGAVVTARGKPIPERAAGKNIALSFSGGLDSLGAYQLAPDHLIRIAVAFGGRWEPEEAFFRTLSPEAICRTNLRARRDRNDSTFMGAVPLLYADVFDLGAVGFGEIFETRAWNYLLRPKRVRQKGFSAAGIVNATLTRGLTQLGTARLARFYTSQDIVRAAIASSAAPGTEKFFRKQLLVDTVKYAFGGPHPDFDKYLYPRKRLVFGGRFSIDFLTLYFIKLYGFETVSRWMDGLDEIDKDALERADLGWYLKYNPIFFDEIPPGLRDTARDRMARAGIDWFQERDWEHYRTVRSFLKTIHDFENR